MELPAVERPRPTAAEDGQLVAGLVHRPVAVESTGQDERRISSRRRPSRLDIFTMRGAPVCGS